MTLPQGDVTQISTHPREISNTDLSNDTANIQLGGWMSLLGLLTKVWMKGQLKYNHITTSNLGTN